LRNIFLLIRRFFVFLLFIILQVLSLSLLVKYNRSQQAKYLETAYEITGKINKRYNAFTRYFSLDENNRILTADNNRLHNLSSNNFTSVDSSAREVSDTTVVDSTQLIRKYLWRDARVINNSLTGQNNYITLERGRNQGIKVDMAVMGPAGIVGRVTDVSDNMSVVMSLLHRKSVTSVMLKKGNITGILEWNGENPALLQLKGIPKSTDVKIGDTVLTSNISLNFPPGLMVGTIVGGKKQKGGNEWQLDVKPGSNFYNLQWVYVIENVLLNEQKELESRAKKTKE
jgi:rod shape-determining protein MreC